MHAAAALARRLQKPLPNLPETIVLHAMVAGYDMDGHSPEEQTDPNRFAALFMRPAPVQVRIELVSLRAPNIIVETSSFERHKRERGIREAFEAAKDLDIVVTSASDWADDDNMLKGYFAQCPATLDALGSVGPRGIMLWHAFNDAGPIDVPTKIRAMTLMELGDLPGFIERRKDVLLVLGPCGGGCGRLKLDTLRSLLAQERPLFNHIAADSRTVRETLDALGALNAGDGGESGGPDGGGNGGGDGGRRGPTGRKPRSDARNPVNDRVGSDRAEVPARS
jgi:hypothetical protein